MNETIITLVLVAVAILWIVMIVKFFRIVSDVRDLKMMYRPKKSSHLDKELDYFYFLAFNGYKDEAKRLLLSMIWESSNMKVMISGGNKKSEYDAYYEDLKRKCQKYFDLLGEEFPDYNLLKNNLKKKKKKS
jgi:hypothetical protein